MIKANVSLIGTVSKAATVRPNKDGVSRFSFYVSVTLPSSTNDHKAVEIYVSNDNASNEDLSTYLPGVHVRLYGTMDIRPKHEESEKKINDYMFFLQATSMSVVDPSVADSISGTIFFTGHLDSKEIIQKTDKNNNPFLCFTGHHSEKDDNKDKWFYVNIRFLRFLRRDEDPGVLRPEWLVPKAKVTISGDLQISTYNGIISITSRISEIGKYVEQQ